MPKKSQQDRTPVIKTDKEWASRQVYDHASYREELAEEIVHPHRALLLETISSYAPFSRFLEIGCGYGPNLYLLAKQFPDAEFVGIDINPVAVQKGNEFFREQGFSNVRLSEGKVQDLKSYADKSFDIVLTDAVLIYITPDEITPVVNEILRVGTVVILNEWQCFNTFLALCTDTYYCFKLQYEAIKYSSEKPSLLRGLFTPKSASLGLYTSHWTRDYNALIRYLASPKNLTIRKIPKESWDDKRWQQWGAIIEVNTR